MVHNLVCIATEMSFLNIFSSAIVDDGRDVTEEDKKCREYFGEEQDIGAMYSFSSVLNSLNHQSNRIKYIVDTVAFFLNLISSQNSL